MIFNENLLVFNKLFKKIISEHLIAFYAIYISKLIPFSCISILCFKSNISWLLLQKENLNMLLFNNKSKPNNKT